MSAGCSKRTLYVPLDRGLKATLTKQLLEPAACGWAMICCIEANANKLCYTCMDVHERLYWPI